MKKIDKTGEIFKTVKGDIFTIIEYYSYTNCTIQFKDGLILKNKKCSNIKTGQIRHPYRPSVYNIGYIGVGKYSQGENSKNNRMYNTWFGMITRAYDPIYQSKFPSYIGCSVDKSWHNFQNFAEWFEKNYIERFELDKDILIKNNKFYSSETCCFVPQEINSLLTKSNRKRGLYPIGVRKDHNKFTAQIQLFTKTKHLGSFNSSKDAFIAYKRAKEEQIKIVANKYRDTIIEKCYNALINYQVEITD